MDKALIYVLPVVFGFALDVFLGDPQRWPHPVRWIGSLINLIEKALLRQGDKVCPKLFKGAVLVAMVVAVSYSLPLFLLMFAARISPYLYLSIASIICYWAIAARSLRDESMKVFRSLVAGETVKARESLSWIVGRDTANLNCEQIAKATVETVAENTSDGVIAPLFFLLIGGAPLGIAYKAVNTMDSMLGYKSEKYLHFGRAAARLDDFANLIPSRLSALFLLLAGWILQGGSAVRAGLRIYRRDRYNHSSPNSAQTEAACAGLLGIRLGGPAYYGGKLVEKSTIGDEQRRTEPEDIVRVNRIMYLGAVLALIAMSGLRCLI